MLCMATKFPHEFVYCQLNQARGGDGWHSSIANVWFSPVVGTFCWNLNLNLLRNLTHKLYKKRIKQMQFSK